MRKTIATVEADLAGCRELLHAARADYSIATAKLDAERKQSADALIKVAQQLSAKDKDVAALKSELFQAHQTIAVQKGYIARTLEDDNMRELGPVDVQPAPSNYPTGPQSRRGGVGFGSFEPDTYRNGASYGSDKPKPWHDR